MSRFRPFHDAGLAVSLLTVVPTRARLVGGERTGAAAWFPAVGLFVGVVPWGLAHLLRFVGWSGSGGLVLAACFVALMAVSTRMLHWDGALERVQAARQGRGRALLAVLQAGRCAEARRPDGGGRRARHLGVGHRRLPSPRDPRERALRRVLRPRQGLPGVGVIRVGAVRGPVAPIETIGFNILRDDLEPEAEVSVLAARDAGIGRVAGAKFAEQERLGMGSGRQLPPTWSDPGRPIGGTRQGI